MNWRILTALVLAFALVPLLPAVEASHFQTYSSLPTEHDDLGSSNEPDFRGVTGILGVSLSERVIDLNLDGRGEPSAGMGPRVLAPGCTDDSGRQPSGLCGLWTVGLANGETQSNQGVPPKLVGVQGLSGANAPGLTALKSRQVRFLDHKVNGWYSLPGLGTTYLDTNRKVGDSGARTLLAGVDPNLGSEAIAYSTADWAWYGSWSDKNGNGVIDHLQAFTNNTGVAQQDPDNEFQWYGNCLKFNSGIIQPGWHCYDESQDIGSKVVMSAYIVPGNHHAYCGAVIAGQASQPCPYVGTDLPGSNLLCLADASTASVVAPGVGGAVALALSRCFTPDTDSIDSNEATFEGDPLFGVQDSVAPDQTYDDRTGDYGFDTRGWYYGLGWATYYYDSSIITSTTTITTVNCKEDGSRRFYDLASCAFVDIDQYKTWNPGLEAIVGGLKPGARQQYTFARDGVGPVNTGIDGQLNHARFDNSATTGPFNDQTQSPGQSREPNNAADSYPGATFGASCAGTVRHNGWCNDYSGYRAASRGWADAQAARTITYDRAIAIDGVPGCIVCTAAPGQAFQLSPEPMPGAFPRPAGNHDRSLGPGQWYMFGTMGRWMDKPQTWTEKYFDLDPLSPTFGQIVERSYSKPADGWVGNIVNATGSYYYRGYADQACTTENGAGTYTHGACHPYADGAIDDPQMTPANTGNYDLHTEWTPRLCDDSSAAAAKITLTPKGGTWTVPVIIFRDNGFVSLPSGVNQVQDFTGRSTPIVLSITCFESGFFLSTDLIILPLGNLGLEVESKLAANILRPTGGVDSVVDVDVFRAWGL